MVGILECWSTLDHSSSRLIVQTHSIPLRRFVAAAAITFGLAACTTDDIVYRDSEPFNPPPDSASGFLGYYSILEGRTTCGNCHADKQVAWRETAHAEAWAGLQSSDHAEEYCQPCHTVNELGNSAVAPGGHNVVPDSAYHDVQCESCHGPGVDHLNNSAAKPLASMGLDEDTMNGCGACHNGEHHPFVEQWEESAHGNVSGYAQGRTDGCQDCHEGKRAAEVHFGVTGVFAEQGTDELLDITCAVCHDPHGSPYTAQLRAPVSRDSKNNLCIECHNQRTVPAATTHGPHGAQGPLVLGEGIGWWPPGFEWLDGLVGTHGNVESNPGLCATCHVESFTVTDPEFFQSVGHTFEAVACLDANGHPTSGPCSFDDRSYGACTTCHGSEANAQFIYERFIGDLGVYLDAIWTDTNDDHHLDAAPTDGGLLAEIVASVGPKELDVSDTLFTFAEGVLWNAQLSATEEAERFLDFFLVVAVDDTVEIGGHAASGNGVHNPPFLDALLRASLSSGADYYGITLPAGLDLVIEPTAVDQLR